VRGVVVGVKSLVALVSVVVLVSTAYAWTTFQNLNNGLTKSDILGGSTIPKLPDGGVDILLVGVDSRVDAQGKPLPQQVLNQLRAGANDGELTDTLIVVRIPDDGKRAYAISIPRDSYVDIPGGYGKHKINSAFSRARNDKSQQLRQQGMTDQTQIDNQATLEGRRELVDTVRQLTGITVDHYAEVNLLGFYDISNAIGGVNVCLKAPTKDRNSGANFQAGQQSIKGGDALAFVRQRENLPRGDLDRIVRQQVFMAGMAKKVLSAGTLTDPGKLDGLVQAIQKSVVLDKDWDVLQFAQQMQGLAAGNMQFVTVPVMDLNLSTQDGSAVKVDPDQVQAFVHNLTGQAATQPAMPGGGPTDAPQPTSGNGSINVDVRNASGVNGLAARVMDGLTAKGFAEGDNSNAANRTTSVVRYPAGGQAAGQAVSAALGGLPVEVDTTIPTGRVRVFLGKDFKETQTGGTARTTAAAPTTGTNQAAAAAPAANPISADQAPCVN
jgi:LCP family protein required for cell wall assembly